MARRPKLEVERERAAQQMNKLVDPKKKKTSKKKNGLPTRENIQRWCDEVDAIRKSSDWDQAKPHHFVGLYVLLHSWCYGVEPAEVMGAVGMAARSSVDKILRDEFGDDPHQFVHYVKWAWKREKGREKWRRQHGKEGGRLTWRSLFQQRFVLTDYRVDQQRKIAP